MTDDLCILGSLLCAEAQARRLSDVVPEFFGAEHVAAAAFEQLDGTWRAEFYLRDEADRGRLKEAVTAITGEALAGALMFETIQSRDWIAASLEGLKIVRAGRFAVHGAHDRDRIAANTIGIEIEAALAFGTGHHGTTLGCLRALEWIARREKPRRILDVGTGTGVLAIAAARAFKAPVIATEIDRASAAIARANLQTNRAGPLASVLHTGSLSLPPIRRSASYDLIFANILLPVLKQLARPIAPLAAPGAFVVLSGLLPSQALAALTRYCALGFKLVRSETVENWTTLTLHKP